MKYTDNNDFKFNCETCDFHTNTSWNMKYHFKSDKHQKNTGEKEQKEKRTYRCHYCLYTSTTQTGVSCHMKKHHKDKKKLCDWSCHTCDLHFDSKANFYIHLRSDCHIKECYKKAYEEVIEKEKSRHEQFKLELEKNI